MLSKELSSFQQRMIAFAERQAELAKTSSQVELEKSGEGAVVVAVDGLEIWLYDDGEAGILGRGHDLRFEKYDYRNAEELEGAIRNAIARLLSTQ